MWRRTHNLWPSRTDTDGMRTLPVNNTAGRVNQFLTPWGECSYRKAGAGIEWKWTI